MTPEQLKTILDDHAKWFTASGGSRANLRRTNLRYVDLRGANLSVADLRGANLRGANLSGANLRGANLSGANLHGANLSGANLHGADLSDADLRYADLRGADLSDADLRYADLRYAKGYIIGPQRIDGYRFDLRLVGNKWCVVAGCQTSRNMTTTQYREHVATYAIEAKCAETLAILDYLDARTPK